MNFSVSVRHKYIVPKTKIENAIDEINKKIITLGVHKEDNSKHPIRDKVQRQVLHEMLYANGGHIPPIDNAPLLKKTETGSEEILYYGGKAHLVEIPSRPVLQPLVQLALLYESKIFLRAIQKQFEFKNVNEFRDGLNLFSNKLGSKSTVYDFIKNRGMGYWVDGEHNSPYVQAVKYFDKLGDAGAAKIADINTWSIKNIANWDATNVYHQGDTPLMDSLDLLNSIKSKIEDR